jgi:shikimate dehydrogenase
VNVLGHTKVLGVFGHPISHSLSPVMHNAAIQALNIDYTYVPFHVLPEDLPKAVEGIRAMRIAGVNVTIPHKERVIECLDEVSENSKQIRSVNTIINVDGRLKGDTTDGPGFLRSAEAAWGKLDGCGVLLLGAGGSAKAVAFALAGIGCEIAIANRTRERAVELAEGLGKVFTAGTFRVVEPDGQALGQEILRAGLVVNTTSVGMHPDVDGIPIPPDLLRRNLLVYDLVYNPARTRLVTEAENRGASAVTGLRMLVYQGAMSFEMWTGIEPPMDVMEEAARQTLGVG